MHPSDRPRSLALAAVAALLSQPALAAEEPVTIAPSTKWQLDYAEDSCALQRLFGEGRKQVFFEIRQFAPDDSSMLTFATRGHRYTDKLPELYFVPDGSKMQTLAPLLIRMNDYGTGYVVTSTMREDGAESEVNRAWLDPARRDAREAATIGFEIRKAFVSPFILQTGNMAAPMTAMRACIDELVSHWGLDAAAQRDLLRKASPNNLPEVVRKIQSSYPREALHRGQQGNLRLRMTVGENGQGTDCKAQMEIGNEAFRKTVCEILLENMVFNPALSGEGQPIASYWSTSVLFRIP